MVPLNFFKLCSGKWQLQRKIGEDVTAVGYAEFILSSDSQMDYSEEVVVNYPGSKMRAYKKYSYCSDQGRVSKYFEGNGLFYNLEFEQYRAYGIHICGQDQYKAYYDLSDENHFIISYKVTGPAKNYLIMSSLIRIS